MKLKKLTSAFSMLELIFVIVILGIVASIGSEMIAKIYEQYIVQRAQHRATMKTELAATQIANRLASAIPGTVYRIVSSDNSYEPLESSLASTADNYYKGIQWVGSDTDSFSATAIPGWSGFCDINASSETSISTPGSVLGTTRTIINKLSSGTPVINLYFPYDTNAYPTNITTTSTNSIPLTGAGASHIVEHYKLAWSSYALVIESGDLYLYYDFTATPAPTQSFVNQNKSLLMKNVSSFKFQGAGRTIRFKICKQENIGEDFNITSCKEKAVF